MSASKQIQVAVIGVGGVGKNFVSQLETLSARLSKQTQISLVLVARSKQMLYNESYKSISYSSWEKDLAGSKQNYLKPQEVAKYLSDAPGKVVLVDNTSGLDWPETYPDLLRRGISVITPNKKGFSDTSALWDDIFAAAANGSGDGGYVFHESTVGAGLPVVSTLKELVECGAEVTKIEGVFSGTMSFLFSSFMPVGGGGGSFSAEVIRAKELGYTEPDPRDDLNGMDVARKLTILARLTGLNVKSATSFPIESLIPKELEDCKSGDEFLSRLPEFDGRMDKLKEEAAKEGKVLRFVGSIDVASQDIKVGLEKFDANHPIAALKGGDNIMSFHSKLAGSSPVIIQGGGAGGPFTALGVIGDLVKVIHSLK